MSLTDRIRKESARDFLASDGTTYLIQAVRDMHLFLTEGLMPDIAMLQEAVGESEDGFLDRLRGKPEVAGKMMQVGMRRRQHMLKRGLIGERASDGTPVTYRMVEKPAHLLLDGEVNPDLIPPALADELFNAISDLSSPPAEVADIAAFREAEE